MFSRKLKIELKEIKKDFEKSKAEIVLLKDKIKYLECDHDFSIENCIVNRLECKKCGYIEKVTPLCYSNFQDKIMAESIVKNSKLIGLNLTVKQKNIIDKTIKNGSVIEKDSDQYIFFSDGAVMAKPSSCFKTYNSKGVFSD